MRLSSWLGLLVLGCVFAANAAEVDACAECKASALADASQCHAAAAPDPALRDKCEKQYAQASQACHERACWLDTGSLLASQCADCLKQADAEMKKCGSVPEPMRDACEARVATMKRTCDEKVCPRPK